MSLVQVTSPHAHGPLSTAQVMRTVLIASLPGIVALTYFFGFGVLVNILWACLVALGCEALALALRRRPIGFYLNDASALVTATLLAIAMPPGSPWWLILVGVAFSILIAKQLYGGLGYNPFNPAMVGYVVLLGKRPGRVEPRAVKRRPKAMRLLTMMRDAARALLLKGIDPYKKQK